MSLYYVLASASGNVVFYSLAGSFTPLKFSIISSATFL